MWVAPFVVRESIGKSVFFFGVNCVDFSFKLDILAASSGQSQTSSVSMPFGRAHLARHSAGVGGSSLGALLRKRKVTGRDASLPAPCLSFLFELVVRETVGALPQTPQGTLSLDSARGNFPLDPFARLSWSRFHASSACGFFYPSTGLPKTSTFGSIVATCRNRSLSVVYRFMMWSFSTICRIISSLPTSTTSFLARVNAV